MIKINLIKGLSGENTGQIKSGTSVSEIFSSRGSGQEGEPSPLVKILIMFLGVGALVVFEQMTVPELQAKLNQKQTELLALTEYNSKVDGLTSDIKKYLADKERLEKQIGAIDSLSLGRMTPVKALDAIQKFIPDKVWITYLGLDKKKLKLNGFGASDGEVSAFIEGLSRSVHFKDVNLIKSGEGGQVTFEGKKYILKNFEIELVLEQENSNAADENVGV